MADKPYNVLFLCTGNSARSVLAEALLNKLGAGRFRAYSAGSFPTGRVNPNTHPILRSLGFDPGDFRSKSWDEFAQTGATPFDLIITVCDSGRRGMPDLARQADHRALGCPGPGSRRR